MPPRSRSGSITPAASAPHSATPVAAGAPSVTAAAKCLSPIVPPGCFSSANALHAASLTSAAAAAADAATALVGLSGVAHITARFDSDDRPPAAVVTASLPSCNPASDTQQPQDKSGDGFSPLVAADDDTDTAAASLLSPHTRVFSVAGLLAGSARTTTPQSPPERSASPLPTRRRGGSGVRSSPVTPMVAASVPVLVDEATGPFRLLVDDHRLHNGSAAAVAKATSVVLTRSTATAAYTAAVPPPSPMTTPLLSPKNHPPSHLDHPALTHAALPPAAVFAPDHQQQEQQPAFYHSAPASPPPPPPQSSSGSPKKRRGSATNARFPKAARLSAPTSAAAVVPAPLRPGLAPAPPPPPSPTSTSQQPFEHSHSPSSSPASSTGSSGTPAPLISATSFATHNAAPDNHATPASAAGSPSSTSSPAAAAAAAAAAASRDPRRAQQNREAQRSFRLRRKLYVRSLEDQARLLSQREEELWEARERCRKLELEVARLNAIVATNGGA
ncbi:hypothetical protein HK405_014084, partial [Cladochytrium tenue]